MNRSSHGKKLSSLALLLLLLGAPQVLASEESAEASAEISAEKRDAIVELMRLTHADQLGRQMGGAIMQQMLTSLEAQGELNEAKRAVIQEETEQFMADAMDRVMPLLVDVYGKHFTTEEIEELNAFYQTPIGQKTIEVMPQLAQESLEIGMQQGQELGAAFGERLMERLEAVDAASASDAPD